MTNSPILRIAHISLAVLALSCGTVVAQPALDTADAQDMSATKNSIKLVRVIAALPAGAPWLNLKIGTTLCISDGITRTWNGGREPQDLPPFSAAFKTELERAGYRVVTPGEDNLFDPQSGSADLQAAAVITDERVDGCISKGGLLTRTSFGDVRGDSSMKIDWQIYSPIKKQVIAHVSTSAAARLENSVPGGAQRLITESFASNVRELASNADFRAALSAPKALTKGFVTPDQQAKILLAGSLKIPKRQIADATGSVVTILTGTGSGSGFLVSTDGYVLTDAHVVGDEKNVRVRWSDGLETLATVERVSQKRDVAVLKTNPRDRAPLALRRGPLGLGQRVYAIGSPGGKKFESTVSSGVVSADRVFDGLRYIQSDTTVSHGSSGGPLLDENGAVIGLTDLGIPNAGPTGDDGPAGLNLFTPIGDAMDFLALEQK
jgi:S1-C subfamily serine protease